MCLRWMCLSFLLSGKCPQVRTVREPSPWWCSAHGHPKTHFPDGPRTDEGHSLGTSSRGPCCSAQTGDVPGSLGGICPAAPRRIVKGAVTGRVARNPGAHAHLIPGPEVPGERGGTHPGPAAPRLSSLIWKMETLQAPPPPQGACPWAHRQGTAAGTSWASKPRPPLVPERILEPLVVMKPLGALYLRQGFLGSGQLIQQQPQPSGHRSLKIKSAQAGVN